MIPTSCIHRPTRHLQLHLHFINIRNSNNMMQALSYMKVCDLYLKDFCEQCLGSPWPTKCSALSITNKKNFGRLSVHPQKQHDDQTRASKRILKQKVLQVPRILKSPCIEQLVEQRLPKASYVIGSAPCISHVVYSVPPLAIERVLRCIACTVA
jgi:hypothetical protein